MAPIPPRISKRQTQPQQQRATTTADVYDELGRPLDSLLRRQKRTDRQQREDITINRQHAAQYDSDVSKGKLIYRDVFPGRKYKLTLSDTTWMGGSDVVRIGYTYDGEFDSTYKLGDPLTVKGTPEVIYYALDNQKCSVSYRLTDIYNNYFWTPAWEA